MGAVGASVAELGIGDFDGQVKIITYGTAERQSMHWHSDIGDDGVWLSDSRQSFRLKTDYRTAALPASPEPGGWIYMSSPNGPSGDIGRTGFGWTPQAIHRADSAYDAGLVLWEKCDFVLWCWDEPDNVDVATVYYDLEPGDIMSGEISETANDNIGTIMTGAVGERKFQTTGWVESQIPTPQKVGILAPHLYVRGTFNTGSWFLEFLNVEWRWMGDPS